MYTLRQYLTTLADTRGLTKTLGEIDMCRDARGRMCYTVGNSAIVFRIRHSGRIRSLRCYMHPPRHLAEIYGERLLPQELFLYTSPETGAWVDVVLGDWIEGMTLHEAATQSALAGDTSRLRRLAAAFDRMAAALTADDWAHGDLKPENIVVDPAGGLHLIDLDAMYLPAFAGEPSPELGTAAFQHPARTARDYDASLDDYPAALISTALHALALDPALYARYREADGLLFTPQQIRTDAALREALALFEREGYALQYRIARLLYAPAPRLFGLAELLAWAVRHAETGALNGAERPVGGHRIPGEATEAGATVAVGKYPESGRGTAGSAHRHTLSRDTTYGAARAGHTVSADYSRDGTGSGAETGIHHEGHTPELFVENGLWGYRTRGQVAIPPLYDSGFDFTEGLAAVRLGATWHYIDTEGRTRIQCAGCEAVKPFRNGRAGIVRDGRKAEIDRAGRELEPFPVVPSGRKG